MAKLTRKQAGERRRYLRKKKTAGTITPVEAAELGVLESPEAANAHEAAPGAAGEPPADEGEPPQPAAQPAPPEADTPPVDAPKPPPVPPAAFPAAGPLPRPPKVAPAPEPEAKASPGHAPTGRWQDKWRAKDGGDGRESTCEGIADQVIGVLKLMADQIKMAGVDPILDPESLRACWVITIDQVLPERVRMTPQMKAVGGSTALLVQRFMKRKEIADAMKVAEDRAKHDEFRRKQHLHSVPHPDAPPPPPVQKAEPPVVDVPVEKPIYAVDATGGEWTKEMFDQLSPTDRALIFPQATVAMVAQDPISASSAFDPNGVF